MFSLTFIVKTLLMGTCMICVYETLLLMPTCTTGRYFCFESLSSAWFVRLLDGELLLSSLVLLILVHVAAFAFLFMK